MNRRGFLKALTAAPVVAALAREPVAVEAMTEEVVEPIEPVAISANSPLRVQQWERQFFKEFIRDGRFSPWMMEG